MTGRRPVLSEATRAAEATEPPIYDVIQYDDIGYEMPHLTLSPDEIDIGYEEPPQETPDESTQRGLCEEIGEQVISSSSSSSSENIANLIDPANMTGASNILAENKRPSYLELVHDTEEPEVDEESVSNRISSSCEISKREMEYESLPMDTLF